MRRRQGGHGAHGRAPRRPPLRAAALAAVLALAGCALGPDFHPPPEPAGRSVLPPDAPRGDLDAAGHAQHFDSAATVPARWWTRFGSVQLDAVVERALRESPNLRAAQATLRQSQDNLRAGYGVFFPQLDASALAQRQSAVINFGRGPVSTGPYTLGTLGATVSYPLDLFGAERRTVEALGAQSDQQRYALLAAYLSLTTNVVNTAIARAAYADQLAATRDIIALQDGQVLLAQAQDEAGTGTYAAVLALQSQRAATRAAGAALEQRFDQSSHLLAQLCGSAPADFAAPALALEQLALPADLPEPLPAALARQRPDVLLAQAALHEASARIGIATADLFPSLSLGAAGGTSHDTIADMLRAGTRFWSVQAGLGGSIFSGGSQWYARKAAIDAYDAVLAQYEAAVLAALDQVADVLRALEHDAQGLRAQAEGLRTADAGARLVTAGYAAGTSGYLEVLAANAQAGQARIAYLGAIAQRLQDTVALYAALGGGWWQADVPVAARPATGTDAGADARLRTR